MLTHAQVVSSKTATSARKLIAIVTRSVVTAKENIHYAKAEDEVTN
jgi:hypothetical protein